MTDPKPALTPRETEERARVVAASALAVLAIIAFLMVIGAPRPMPIAQPRPGLDASDVQRFARDPAACIAELREAGLEVEPIPDLHQGTCGYRQAVELTRSFHSYSAPVAGQCALAAALVVWERDVLVPVAVRRLGAPVARIELAAPAYQCRPIAGRSDGRMSEHAYADAIDISGFTLVNGRVISVREGWAGRTVERQFLREVRNGACTMFRGVFSPDYNAAHHDHLHFDLGRDKMCR